VRGGLARSGGRSLTPAARRGPRPAHRARSCRRGRPASRGRAWRAPGGRR
jgi:hypothetical protein